MPLTRRILLLSGVAAGGGLAFIYASRRFDDVMGNRFISSKARYSLPSEIVRFFSVLFNVWKPQP